METARTLKGFRDFLPAEKAARDWVERRIVEVFERFGFQPLETPTLEYASLILGKYGEEADRLVYTFEDRGGRRVALPYDQTVPTARVLMQYGRELPRCFRRWSIRDVFRAESPQKGRYREFKQCDVDIYGSSSPLADAEILACTWAAFAAVGFADALIRINDRRVLVETLRGFASPAADVFSIIRSIDKLDKLSHAEVRAELERKGLAAGAAAAALEAIERAAPSAELAAILEAACALGVPARALVLSPTLARGLDYYTGAIFEVSLASAGSGSLAGGGRYDELIQELGGPDMPAVGIAFGFDRMVEAAREAGLVPEGRASAEVLVAVFDERTGAAALDAAGRLRAAGVRCEVYPAPDKLGKQLKAADQKGIPLVVLVGPEEAERGAVALRRMDTGEQRIVERERIVEAVVEALGRRVGA